MIRTQGKRSAECKWTGVDFKIMMAGLFACILIAGQVHAQSSGYWHTSGSQILDSSNRPVRIAGINWYGFETTDEVVHGLWVQDYKAILNTIQNNGYNVVRIPFSNQMIEQPIVPANISYYGNGGPINTDLRGLNSLQILDRIIDAAGSTGLRVILDNHRSEAGNSAEDSGLWYTPAYPETAWIQDWTMLAQRYLNNTTVIGFDLRNEPHNAGSGGACWDCGTMGNDWHLAAQRVGNAILAVNPHLLIAVEGTDCYGGDCGWWGGHLEGAGKSPVVLSVPDQLIYSAHDYGPNLYAQTWFNASTTASSLVQVWTKYWAYLSLNGIAPVWVGEFGTTNQSADLQSSSPGSQGQWFQNLIAFLQSQSQIGWTYWALNGEDSYALLNSDYGSAPASPEKQAMLASIQFRPSNSTPTPASTATPAVTSTATPTVVVRPTPSPMPTPRPTPTAVGNNISCAVAYTVTSDWGSGFIGGLTLTNNGSAGINGWQLTWTWAGNQAITGAWNANFAQNGNSVELTNSSWNAAIPSGGTLGAIGFQATYQGSNQSPGVFYLNGKQCLSQAVPTPTVASTATPTAVVTPTPSPMPTPQPTPTAVGNNVSCAVAYTVTSDWGSGFIGGLTVTNDGSAGINGWQLTWTWAGNQAITGVWNANSAQNGASVELTNASWNAVIPSGGTLTGIGFQATYQGSNQPPGAFYLNGKQCLSQAVPRPTPQIINHLPS